MILKTAYLSWKMSPKVVHRLPGRLRVHIPILVNTTKEFQQQADVLIRLFVLPSGIDSVQPNFITANVLIKYDANHMSEDNVLNWIKHIKGVSLYVMEKFTTVADDKKERVTQHLLDFLQQMTGEQIEIDHKLKIPEHVWC